MTGPTRRLFRFFQWNDFHIRDEGVAGRSPGYPRGNEKAAWARRCALGRGGIEPPDLTVSAGDLIDGEIADYGCDFAALQSVLLDGLTMPVLPCLGNHENQQDEGDPASNAGYDRFHGTAWHNYAYTVGGLAFIVIDSSGGHRGVDEVSTARLEFAARALRRFAGMPILVVTHIPLVPMREPAVLAASFGFSSWLNLDPRLLGLIESHASDVVAVLSGHLHITAAREQRGIYHVVPSGTAGYPTDFASFDVYADRLEVKMHAAPAGLLDAGKEGNIHGRPRHATDYTDSGHPDHESYLWGSAAEREFVIPLTGTKRLRAEDGRELAIYHERGLDEWVAASEPPVASERSR